MVQDELIEKDQNLMMNDRLNRELVTHVYESENDSFILFIHGAGGRAEQWVNQINHFKKNYYIVAPDLLGHGQSPKPKKGYAFSELVKDIEAIFNTHKKVTNIVIGHSYGVALALFLAEKHREEIDKLILLGAGIPRKSNGLGIWRLPSFILELLRPIFSRNFVEKAFHPDTDIEFVKREKAISDTNPMYVMKALIKGMGQIPPIQLDDITTSTLIINGETDGLTPVEGARELSNLLPNSKVEVVSKASHLVMMEQPDIVNKLIGDLINQSAEKD